MVVRNKVANKRVFFSIIKLHYLLVIFQIAFPNFHFYDLLDVHKMYAPDCLKEFPRLQAYTKRFEV
jgi:hypothetical protein